MKKTITVIGRNGPLDLTVRWIGKTFAVTDDYGSVVTKAYKITHIASGYALPRTYWTIKRAKSVALILEAQKEWQIIKFGQAPMPKELEKLRALHDKAEKISA